MPVFKHTSSYPKPVAEVFTWHTRPGAVTRLTPPGWATVLSEATNSIAVGSQVRLRISSPVAQLLPGKPGWNWLARHVEQIPGRLFVDEQLAGPFSRWRHEHHFADGPGDSTVVTDIVHWEAPAGVPRGLVEKRLRRLFDFRSRQLRADLALAPAPPKKVVVAGASGLVGTQLVALLRSLGHRVVCLVRRDTAHSDEARWCPTTGQLPEEALVGADAVVNLAGHTIGGRFTARNKQLILNSRVKATGLLAKACARAGVGVLVQASAIGIYGARRPGEPLSERSERGPGFLADVVAAWEQAAEPAREAGVRTVFLRTGIALSAGGGALLPQLPLFLVGLGGRMGARDAWLSWITLDDLTRAYAHALITDDASGPLNAVAPAPATQQEFAEVLGRVLRRPAWLPTPSLGPKFLLGREGYDQLINTDQLVAADALLSSGFCFASPTLADGLRHVLLA